VTDDTRQASKTHKGTGTLVSQLVDKLRKSILAGDFQPGERLPSEARMTIDHEVSRTVIREAIAVLRSDGLVEPRQGAGVFVLAPPAPVILPFQDVDSARISSVIELLELRTAVEIEAAALAALRRSPQQEETILARHRDLFILIEAGKPTSDADFALHLAIAEATNNPRFAEFLQMIGKGGIPRAALAETQDAAQQHEYMSQIHQEHAKIVQAISHGDEAAARNAMKLHLRGSLSRYRAAHQRTLEKL
jgi:GntR family transcriptional regulator, transcriptional repressor for pyruvate dehydrogenase complex